jgi:hypothetical protein
MPKKHFSMAFLGGSFETPPTQSTHDFIGECIGNFHSNIPMVSALLCLFNWETKETPSMVDVTAFVWLRPESAQPRKHMFERFVFDSTQCANSRFERYFQKSDSTLTPKRYHP